MLTKAEFSALLRQQGPLILDGALATELEARGHNLNHPLWSGKVLQEDPEAIASVHLDYHLSGADIATTASYQASTRGLREHLKVEESVAVELIKRSVRLAQHARSQAYNSGHISEDRNLLIAGSIGPFGAYLGDGSEYRGDYVQSAEAFQYFHRPRISALVDAGVDLLAIETMPSFPEISAVCELLQEEFPEAVAWISVTLKDSEHISDGTPLDEVLQLVQQYPQIVAFGVNCVPMTLVSSALQNMEEAITYDGMMAQSRDMVTRSRDRHQAMNGELALLCYPNSGESWNAETKTWSGSGAAADGQLTTRVAYWLNARAQMIGGCCRTGPGDIRDMAKAIKMVRDARVSA